MNGYTEATYRDALNYLYHFTDYEKRGLAAYAPEFYNLDRVRRLLALLGDPHHTFESIHIAGTKGKGSTAALIESILRAAGLRTGLYTSPHLHTFRERIRVGGELIPEDEVVRWVAEMRPLLAQIPEITTFEVMTGLAFAWFAAQGVEWAVLEVGLGGRLDATNVVTPAVAVITAISLDHTAILGETHAEIAREKAGIVKAGVPVVSAPQVDEALAVIEAVCRDQNAPLTLVGRDWTWSVQESGPQGQSFSVHCGGGSYENLWLPLLGQVQVVNATTALAAVSLLEGAGVWVSTDAIREGLRAVHWPARLEVLSREPLLVADSAHNGDSARKLMATLRDVFDPQRRIVVMGASADHVTPALLEAFFGGADRAIVTQAQHPRAADPAWIKEQAADLGFDVETSPAVSQALDLALAEAAPGTLICCTGSVFVAAEARAAWFARQGEPLPPSDPL